MGFLNNFSKLAQSVAKDVVGDIVEQTLTQNQPNKPTQSSTQKPINNNKTIVENLINKKIEIPFETKTIEHSIYHYDEQDVEHEIKQSIEIHNDFFEVDTGCGEIDIVVEYSPTENSQNINNSPFNNIVIGTGFMGKDEDIVSRYLNGKSLENATIISLNDDKLKYKTVRVSDNDIIIAYHFYHIFDNTLLYQVFAEYPKKLHGTNIEDIIIMSLDKAAQTLKEEYIY